MSEVNKLADRIALIMNGRVCWEGTAAELRTAYDTNDPDELYTLMIKKGREMP
jgi:ABC-type Na+ transport system ATPase subunit NatA